MPPTATPTPAAPPASPSSRLSVTSCRHSRPCLAPRARRRANSVERSVSRINSRFATLALATSRTISTTPASTSSVGRTWPTTASASGSPCERETRSGVVGVLAGDRGRDRLQLGIQRRPARSVCQARHHREDPESARQFAQVAAPRQPGADRGHAVLGSEVHPEPARHHPHHRPRLVVEVHAPADDAGVAAEALLPELVAEQHHVGAPVFLLARQPSQKRRHAERFEKSWRDPADLDLRRGGAAAAEHARPGPHRAAPRDGPRALDDVHDLRTRQLRDRLLLPRKPRAHHGQPLRRGERQRRQQHRIDHREDHRRGRDTERQRQHDDRRQQRTAAPVADGETGVLDQCVHHGLGARLGLPRRSARQDSGGGLLTDLLRFGGPGYATP